MNRLLCGVFLLILVVVGGWAQSTWRGQAEVWKAADVPMDGFVAASNEFPRNSLLSIENYKTKKTVQVRVVAALPVGSSALVLLNPKAAQALEIKSGDSPLVGVRIDPSGVERPDNPDPDVNPLALKPTTPAIPAPLVEVPALAVAAVTPKVPEVSSLDVAAGATSLDPDLMPLPSLATPELVPEPDSLRTPLAIADEPEEAVPLTPGKKVFVTTRDPEPVAAETPAVTEAPVAAEDVVAVTPAPVPLSSKPPYLLEKRRNLLWNCRYLLRPNLSLLRQLPGRQLPHRYPTLCW